MTKASEPVAQSTLDYMLKHSPKQSLDYRLVRDLADARKQHGTWRDTAKAFEVEVNALRAEVERLTSQHVVARAEVHQCEEAEADRNALRAEVERLTRENEELDQVVQRFVDTNADSVNGVNVETLRARVAELAELVAIPLHYGTPAVETEEWCKRAHAAIDATHAARDAACPDCHQTPCDGIATSRCRDRAAARPAMQEWHGENERHGPPHKGKA